VGYRVTGFVIIIIGCLIVAISSRAGRANADAQRIAYGKKIGKRGILISTIMHALIGLAFMAVGALLLSGYYSG
jgi:hypothetical protein